jgi:hypothetical protein
LLVKSGGPLGAGMQKRVGAPVRRIYMRAIYCG